MSDFCLWILNLASLLVFFVGFFIFWYNHPWFLTVKGERKKRKMKEQRKTGCVLMLLGIVPAIVITLIFLFFS